MLQGDASKPGLYIQLMRWHPYNMSRPHTHDMPRYIRVVSGTWWVGTGAKDGECVLMIVGEGPVKTSSPGRFEVGPIDKDK